MCARKMGRLPPRLLVVSAGCCGLAWGTGAVGQNGGPGPDLDPGGIGIQRVDLPDIQAGGITVRANVLGSVGSGGLTQMAVTDAFAGTLFFSDRDGQVRRFGISTGSSSVILDLNDAGRRNGLFQVNGAASGQGLRGLAFHPDFNNFGAAGYGKFYTAHEEVFGSSPAHRPLLATNALGQPFNSDGGRQDGVVVEWDYDFGANAVVAGSGRDVYRVQIPYSDHVLQQIGFNPHAQPGDADYGLLYAGIGDGGGATSPGPGVDTNRVGQDFRTPLASIIRIDPIQQSGANPFGIPNDNPFAGVNEDPDIAGEIYAKGFRHPQTLGFDPATGKVLSGDIGQNNIEEINVIEPGGNYGYSAREGTYVYLDQRSVGNGQAADTSLFEVPLNTSTVVSIQTDGGFVNQTVGPRNGDGFSYPAIQADHVQNANNGLTAIVSGYVYHGDLIPDLSGQYLFGFLSNNMVAYADAGLLDADGVPTQPQALRFTDINDNLITINQALGTGSRTLMRFGQDLDGEIYVFSQMTGHIVRLEQASPPPAGAISWGPAQELISSADLISGVIDTKAANGGTDAGLVVNGITFEAFMNSGGFSTPTAQPSFFSVTAGLEPDGVTPGSVSTFGAATLDTYTVATDSLDLDTILAAHVFEGGDNAPLTITLTDLVVGAEYKVQLIAPADDRACCGDRSILVDGGDGNGGVTLSRLADLDGDTASHATFAVGTFTAAATTRNILMDGDFSGGFAALILAQMSAPIPGDTDSDGDIDDFDLLNAISNFTGSLPAGTGGKDVPEGDTDADADVDDFDLLTMISGFTGSLSPPVPEPASAALLGLGGLLMIARRRRA